MPAETRYLRNQLFYMNQQLDGNFNPYVYAYGMGIASTDLLGNNYVESKISRHKLAVRFGFRAWREYIDGDYVSQGEELTSGTPVQIGERTAEGEGYQSTTWTPPQTTFNRSDCLVIRFYVRWRVGSTWILPWAVTPMLDIVYGTGDFTTESRGIIQLNASTWTITAYTKWFDDGVTNEVAQIYFGDSTYNSRIENILLGEKMPSIIFVDGKPALNLSEADPENEMYVAV